MESEESIICSVNKLHLNQILRGTGRIFIILTSFALLAGCKSIIKPSDSYISEQQAMDAALATASSSHPEMSGSQAIPSNVTAKQMTLLEAVKMINKNNQPATGYDPTMMVWFVTMDGLWLGEMSAQGIVSIPELVSYHLYAIIIDAKTGLELESSLSP